MVQRQLPPGWVYTEATTSQCNDCCRHLCIVPKLMAAAGGQDKPPRKTPPWREARMRASAVYKEADSAL